mgnify:CR=1 FL=1
MDKGYNDYAWYKQLTDKGIFLLHSSKPTLPIVLSVVDLY